VTTSYFNGSDKTARVIASQTVSGSYTAVASVRDSAITEITCVNYVRMLFEAEIHSRRVLGIQSNHAGGERDEVLLCMS